MSTALIMIAIYLSGVMAFALYQAIYSAVKWKELLDWEDVFPLGLASWFGVFGLVVTDIQAWIRNKL